MGFNILYSGDPHSDVLSLCSYIDEFYSVLGITSAEIDITKIKAVIYGMYQDFPHPTGSTGSSPFKKVAAFTVNFCAESPIRTSIPKFKDLQNFQNAIVAYALSIDALDGAGFNGSDKTLSNRVEVSTHFYKDLILCFSKCIPSQHFDSFALIYESLAYQANPTASYEPLI